MKHINAYDFEADIIEKVADDNDISECEVIEMLVEYLEQMKENNNLI